MDILVSKMNNPQVSLIQANELFHFTRYIYPKYSQIWMLSATAQGCRHAADEICNIASSHEPCTWGKILRNMHFGMGINLHVFFFVLMQLKYDHPPRLTCCVHGYQKISRSTSNQRFVAIIKNVNQSQKHVVYTTGGATKEFCIHSWVILRVC